MPKPPGILCRMSDGFDALAFKETPQDSPACGIDHKAPRPAFVMALPIAPPALKSPSVRRPPSSLELVSTVKSSSAQTDVLQMVCTVVRIAIPLADGLDKGCWFDMDGLCERFERLCLPAEIRRLELTDQRHGRTSPPLRKASSCIPLRRKRAANTGSLADFDKSPSVAGLKSRFQMMFALALWPSREESCRR